MCEHIHHVACKAHVQSVVCVNTGWLAGLPSMDGSTYSIGANENFKEVVVILD